jgi:hypothetical protein
MFIKRLLKLKRQRIKFVLFVMELSPDLLQRKCPADMIAISIGDAL